MSTEIIPAHHLAYLNEMRALYEDDDGRLILRGLAFEETVEYLAELDAPGSSERFEALDDKHQYARMAAIAFEATERSA